MSEDKTVALEERIAHLSAALDDMSDEMTRQGREIDVLTRRVAMLMQPRPKPTCRAPCPWLTRSRRTGNSATAPALKGFGPRGDKRAECGSGGDQYLNHLAGSGQTYRPVPPWRMRRRPVSYLGCRGWDGKAARLHLQSQNAARM